MIDKQSAPASRSGEDHAAQRAALCFAGGVLHLNTGGKSRLFIGDSDVAVEYDGDGNTYVELDRTEIEFLRDKLNAYLPVSRDSGEAVKRAQEAQDIGKYAARSRELRWDPGHWIRTLAADVLSLSASAARLREALVAILGWRERDREDMAEVIRFIEDTASEALRLSPTASPPEGQT